MDPKQQNRAIALAYPNQFYVIEDRECWGQLSNPNGPHNDVNFLKDLNALHVVEKSLTETQQDDYNWSLQQVTGVDISARSCDEGLNLWPFIHITASQRAEALLRALNLYQA